MTANWPPSATIETLQKRAQILKKIRAFFAEKKVMEVETPLMCHTSVTDPFIQSIPALFAVHPNAPLQSYYLQTSPEYAMKRLLAAGSGAIYQISKAFRQGEIGRLHNPEFSMLEWYQPDFDHHDLMNDVDALLQFILGTKPAERISYTQLFETHLAINVHQASLSELAHCANEQALFTTSEITDRDTWLNLLMTHCIEPKLGWNIPCFIYDYPSSQAALARLQATEPPVASRFEVYMHGMELANGFHELQNVEEQRKRFEENVLARKQQGLSELPIDENFLAALKNGLPDCSGVALGIDRLMMIALQHSNIAEVLSFDFSRV